MDALRIARLVKTLSGRLTARATVDGQSWDLVEAEVAPSIMNDLEAAPRAAFERVARTISTGVQNTAPNTPHWALVIVGGPFFVQVRRAFLDPEGHSCALDYQAQERVAATLVAATSPPSHRICEPCTRTSIGLPVSDALLRLVLRAMTQSDQMRDFELVARTGLPIARVVEILEEASRRGMALWSPVH